MGDGACAVAPSFTLRVTIGAFTRPRYHWCAYLLPGATGSVLEPNLVNLNDYKRWDGKGFRPYRFLRGEPYLRADVGRSTEGHFQTRFCNSSLLVQKS